MQLGEDLQEEMILQGNEGSGDWLLRSCTPFMTGSKLYVQGRLETLRGNHCVPLTFQSNVKNSFAALEGNRIPSTTIGALSHSPGSVPGRSPVS